MRFLLFLQALLATTGVVQAQCGAGTPDVIVDGSEGAYATTQGGSEIYSGSDYMEAIQAALDSVSSGGRVAVIASGSIGTGTISIGSGVIFEGCGTIDVQDNGGGSIKSLNTQDAQIPYLSLTGAPYFGLYFYGTSGLTLGEINMELSGGMGIRFDRDEAPNTDVTMGTITVSGAGSHAVETWNIDGLVIEAVIGQDIGECGLLLQKTTNAQVGLVDCTNCGTGNGYAALRFANQNGMLSDGSYATNVYVDSLIASGGGRGLFCVSESGGVEIANVEISDTGNNAILLENCYGVSILGGTVNGGGEVRIASRSDFAVSSDISISLAVDGTSVRESPCGENITWNISGDASLDIC